MRHLSGTKLRNVSPRGFTLIELLITMAIVAILAGILFAVFASSREHGRSTTCINNYHQMALAVQQYAQDYDDSTPPDGGSFAGLIADSSVYGAPAAVFTCPSDYDRVTEHRAGSYRMASLYQGRRLSCGWGDPYNNGAPTRTSSTILLYEAEQDFTQSPIIPTYRHNHGTQVLYFDGHSNWLPQGKNTADKDD
ncbi:MAG TPA: type II secretion system protein [Capsulimonadaceae bacterium]|jgi:prepilin-type N-terminal cleavage/methylation domain-containing protein/prepilin-type processing-associated H-X9-DG protein